MSTTRLVTLAGLIAVLASAVPAMAGISPYVRTDFSGTGLRMTDGNKVIMDDQAALQAAGLPAHFSKVGTGYGPGLAAGVWLTPSLRVGATYSYHKSVNHNLVDVPGTIFYAHDLDFRMREIGAEAAWRFQRFGGLIVGANVAQGRAQMIERVTDEEIGGSLYLDSSAEHTKPTYGGWVGIDQTNAGGVAGYVRLGFQYRDMGRMPSAWTLSDGVNSVSGTAKTIWLDYTGIYFNVGVGFDRVR
jgi:hypothetical protein